MNREQRRNKKANKLAQWIVKSILKLPDDELIQFFNLINNELHKRGVI